jgi:ABC-type lipoprotein release transport system permease subunit
MIAADLSRLAARNLRQAKLRTTLTTAGVAIGVGALTCMVSFGLGIQEQLLGQFLKSGLFDTITVTSGRLGFGPGFRGRPEQSHSTAGTPAPALDNEALKKFAAIDHVKEVYPNVRVPVEISTARFRSSLRPQEYRCPPAMRESSGICSGEPSSLPVQRMRVCSTRIWPNA